MKSSITYSGRSIAGWGVFLVLLLCAGCAGSGKSSYYTLYPMGWLSPKNTSIDSGVFIEIGPVSIPEYIDRSQIVSRKSRYSVDVSDMNHWAETLDGAIQSVITENIANILDTDSVYGYPWKTGVPAYQVKVDIIKFDGALPGNVELFARWSLLKNGSESIVENQKFHTRKPIAGEGYEGMVSTMSLVLYDMSYNIAQTIGADQTGN